jgi:outer membrane receptor for ferrienterochelin and colicins
LARPRRAPSAARQVGLDFAQREAQDEWEVTRLQAYLGLRWEGLDTATAGLTLDKVQTRSSVWSPVTQMVWKLPGAGKDQLRLALARTYKAPLPRNLVPRRYTVNNDNGPANPDIQGNPALRPELAWGLDAAFESYFGKGGVASVSVYGRRIRDVTVQRLFLDGASWVSAPANDGTASAHGIEFDAKVPLNAFDLRANAARNWSRVDSVNGPNNRLAQLTPALSSYTGVSRVLDLYGLWKMANKTQLRLSVTNALHQDERSARYYSDLRRTVTTPGSAGVKLALERIL